MKKAVVFLVVVFMVGPLMSCGGGGNGSPSMAALSVLFAPNPVNVSPDGMFRVRVTVTEENGIGVEITSLRISNYAADDSVINVQNEGPAWFAEQFDDCGGSGTYIPGGSLRCADLEYGGSAVYSIFTFFGLDDLGNNIEGSGRLDLNNRSKSPSESEDYRGN
jgi:hypothetical protein